MLRIPLALIAICFALTLAAAEPTPIEKSLAIQHAIGQARTNLVAGEPAKAVKSLEQVLPMVDGNSEFLGVLHEAYSTELKKQEVAKSPDAKRIAELKDRIALLEKPSERQANAPPVLAPAPAPKGVEATPDLLRVAADLFQQARTQPEKFNDAAIAFSKAVSNRVELSPDQLAAWAYCRVRLAVDSYNTSPRDSATAGTTVREIEDALQLAPHHAELQTFGRKVITDLGGKPMATPTKLPKPTIREVAWLSLESEHFQVRFQGSPEAATAVLTKAEGHRQAIFARWSGGPPNAWQPKCELMLHLTATDFAAATNQSPDAAGHAFVKLDAKKVIERRIDLRADDAALTDDTLPRELAYVILADLFPHQAAPKWATIGIAVLSSGTEAERCAKTLSRCQREGRLLPVATVFELNGSPKPDAITAYYVESVSIVDHLVRKKGEKAFRLFLLDTQRYGTANALQRHYGVENLRQFEDEWRRSALTTARGQTP